MNETSYFTSNITEGQKGDETEIFVASGSTSVCYKMMYHDKLCLKKRLRKEFCGDTKYEKAFVKEFEIGQKIDHPNIVKYYDIGKDDDGAFIRAEYIDGMPLSVFVKEYPDFFGDKSNGKRFVSELLSAVDSLHKHRILHLDLKPDNIMMTAIGNHVKLIDLGFCYQDAYPFSVGKTDRYCAPEQAGNDVKRLSAATDVYAIGRILQELNIGKAHVINKCLQTDVHERYQTVGELEHALLSGRRAMSLALPVAVIFAICLISVLTATNVLSRQTMPMQNSKENRGSVAENIPDDSSAVIKAKQSGNSDGQDEMKGQTVSGSAELGQGNGAKSKADDISAEIKRYAQASRSADPKNPYPVYSEPQILPPLKGVPDAKGLAVQVSDGEYCIITDRETIENMKSNAAASRSDFEAWEEGAALQFYKARMSYYFRHVNAFLLSSAGGTSSGSEFNKKYQTLYDNALGDAERDVKCKPYVKSKSGKFGEFNNEFFGMLNTRAKAIDECYAK